MQSPSEWTEDTEDGLSPPDRPGPGDLALRPLERPLPFEDFPPPANIRCNTILSKTTPVLFRAAASNLPVVSHSLSEELSELDQSWLRRIVVHTVN